MLRYAILSLALVSAPAFAAGFQAETSSPAAAGTLRRPRLDLALQRQRLRLDQRDLDPSRRSSARRSPARSARCAASAPDGRAFGAEELQACNARARAEGASGGPSGDRMTAFRPFWLLRRAPDPILVAVLRQYELVEKVRGYDPDADEAMINRAYVFSMKAHGIQTRASGDPYYSHPIEVAGILTDLHLDDETIVTAILHDTIEDTLATPAEIRKLFGKNVARLVDGVTKLSKIEAQSESQRAAENLRKFLLAMSDDIRVLLVKLADRLHNMRTLHHHQGSRRSAAASPARRWTSTPRSRSGSACTSS